MILVTEDIIKTFNESTRFTLIKERLALEKVPILSRREYALLGKEYHHLQANPYRAYSKAS